MTIGIAVVASDGIVLAADSRVVSGEHILPSPSPKIERWSPDTHVVSAGDVVTLQKLRNSGEELCGLAETMQDEGSEECELLCHRGDEVWHVLSDGAVLPVTRWSVIGVGGPYAMGLLHHIYEGSDDTTAWWGRILGEHVLPAVSACNPYCGPPYEVKVLPRGQ